MVYRTDQPVAGSSLRRSQPLLQENTSSANTTFELDHYPFNDTTANIGLHKQVTNPVQVTAPSTSADQTKLYTLTPHATIGPMQFTRGESNAIPTPLTNLHGTLPALAPSTNSTSFFDFAGTPLSQGVILYQSNIVSAGTTLSIYNTNFAWDGTRLVRSNTTNFSLSGTNIRVFNNNTISTQNNIVWTINFFRCST